jgi:GNAT superfamily N-acetyltransferase
MQVNFDYVVLATEPKETQHTLGNVLYTDNAEQIGHYKVVPLAYCAKSQVGQVLGSIYAFIKLGWLEIDMVWVQEKARRQGIATQLLQHIELAGRRLGAHWASLSAGSFQQGLPLYQKQGYQIYATLPILNTQGEKYQKYYLQKTLVETL